MTVVGNLGLVWFYARMLLPSSTHTVGGGCPHPMECSRGRTSGPASSLGDGLFGHFFLSSLGPFSIESSGTAGRGSIISCLGRLHVALVSTRYPGSVYPGSVTIHVHLFWQQLPRHGNFEYSTCNVGRLLSAYK